MHTQNIPSYIKSVTLAEFLIDYHNFNIRMYSLRMVINTFTGNETSSLHNHTSVLNQDLGLFSSITLSCNVFFNFF